MKQLTGMDAQWVYLEQPSMPMHVAGLAIYDQSTAPGGVVRFKDVVANTIESIDKRSTLRHKLKKVPFDLDHPYWVLDEDFDPEFHIRHIALPKPGDWRQLCILVARLHARTIDRERPLWEMYVIEGLGSIDGFPKDAFGVYSKIHHAAADGSAARELLEAIHELTPTPKGRRKKQKPAHENRTSSLKIEASNYGLVAKAALNNIRSPFRMLSVARNTFPNFGRVYSRLRKGELRTVGPVPRTRFNGRVSAHRVVCGVKLDLADMKRVKDSLDRVTINDLAIAIVGGAMRKYLKAKGELPEESLVAMVPINVRKEVKDADSQGNVVSAMLSEIRSDIEPAADRIQAVAESTRASKELSRAIGATVMTDYSRSAPSALTAQASKLSSQLRWGDHIKPAFNTTITNVPGPQVPLYSAGAQLVANFGMVPIGDGAGLVHVINSNFQMISITVTACRVLMPDPEFYEECLRESVDEVLALAKKTPVTKRRSSQKAARVKRRAQA